MGAELEARSLSKIDPRRFGAALGMGERERERGGRESEAGKARSSAATGATSPEGDSRRD